MSKATYTLVGFCETTAYTPGRYGAPGGHDVFRKTIELVQIGGRTYQSERFTCNGITTGASQYPADGSAEHEAYARKRCDGIYCPWPRRPL